MGIKLPKQPVGAALIMKPTNTLKIEIDNTTGQARMTVEPENGLTSGQIIAILLQFASLYTGNVIQMEGKLSGVPIPEAMLKNPPKGGA